MELKRVVITGLGAITPIGKNVSDYWDSLCKGVSGASMITRFDASKFRSRIACEVKDFDPLQYFDRKEARKLDLFEQFAMISADEAIQDSGINRDNTDFTEVGVIFASGIGGIESLSLETIDFARGDGTPRVSPFTIPKLLPDLAAGNISIKYGFQGPNYCTVSACASSANAIVNAFRYIHYGRNEVMIAGGAEAPICPISVAGFEAMKALSTRNDDPSTASRPFDADRAVRAGAGMGGLRVRSALASARCIGDLHFRDAARGLGLRGVFRRGVRRRGDAVPARLRSADALVRPALDPWHLDGRPFATNRLIEKTGLNDVGYSSFFQIADILYCPSQCRLLHVSENSRHFCVVLPDGI